MQRSAEWRAPYDLKSYHGQRDFPGEKVSTVFTLDQRGVSTRDLGRGIYKFYRSVLSAESYVSGVEFSHVIIVGAADDNCLSMIRELLPSFTVIPVAGPVPLCRARNHGAKISRFDKLIFSDARCYLDPTIFAATLSSKCDVQLSWSKLTTEVSEKDLKSVSTPEGYDKILKQQYGGEYAVNLYDYLAVNRDSLFHVGGYDEAYDEMLACWDNDVIDRLVASGMSVENISISRGVLNAASPPYVSDFDCSDTRYAASRTYYYSTESVCRNDGVFGELFFPDTNDICEIPDVADSADEQETPANKREPIARRVAEVIPKKIVEAEVGVFPSVSVIVCASGDRYSARLHRCLDSVYRQVGVRMKDVEVILHIAQRPGDSGSSDLLEKIARSYGATVLKTYYEAKGYNYSYARNYATRMSRGAILCYLDADTVLSCETFKTCLPHTNEQSFVVVHCAFSSETDHPSSYQSSDLKKFKESVNKFRLAPAGFGGCVFVSRIMVDSVDGWDEHYNGYGGPDQDMCFRLIQAGHTLVQAKDTLKIKAIHQYHPRREYTEVDLWNKNREYLNKSEKGELPIRRNPTGFAGIKNAITVLVPHHPLRPISVLNRVLAGIQKASSIPVVVDLYVQGPCELPDVSKYSMEVNIIQMPSNQGVVPPRAVSIGNMLKRDHKYWAQVDDNAVLGADAIDMMISVLQYEKERGVYHLGCVQISNQRGAQGNPSVVQLGSVKSGGIPTLKIVRGNIAKRSYRKLEWRVGDIVGSGHTVFSREVFDLGVMPDPEYKLGLVDYDMCFQMNRLGYRAALLTSHSCEKVQEGCYTQEYQGVRRDREKLQASYKHFSSKWMVNYEF